MTKAITPIVPLCIIAVCIAHFAAMGSACPYSDSLWEDMRGSQQTRLMAGSSVKGLDADCFVNLLRRVRNQGSGPDLDKIVALIETYYSTGKELSLGFFFAVIEAVRLDTTPGLRPDLLRVWEQHSGRASDMMAALENRGEFARMDSLYTLRKQLVDLDVYDILNAAKVKGILGDFAGAAKLYCEVGTKETRLPHVVRGQLLNQLHEEEDDARRSALKTFGDCYVPGNGADSASFRRWLSGAYLRYKHYEEEVEAIERFAGDRQVAGREFFIVARRRFSRGLFAHTPEPARLAFDYLADEAMRLQAAVLLYQSYVQLKRVDSALVWFSKAGLNDARSAGQAAALYQQAGLINKADSLIKTLPEAVMRDSLEIRQQVYLGDLDKAQKVLAGALKQKRWQNLGQDNWLWRARLAVMSGDLASSIAVVDSARFDPAWSGAQELLRYKLAVQLFKQYPDTYDVWGKLQSALYRGKPEEATEQTGWKSQSKEISELFAVHLGKALSDKGMHDQAAQVLGLIPSETASARVTYFRAEALFNLGRIEEAKRALEDLVLNHPRDVYSSKARIYLHTLESRSEL